MAQFTGDSIMNQDSIFIYSPELLKYKFSDHHPFNPLRLKLTLDLLMKSNAIKTNDIVPPRFATKDELSLLHDIDYIEAVQQASHGLLSMDRAENYGLGTEDTPIFPNMHENSALLVGGSLTAADYFFKKDSVY